VAEALDPALPPGLDDLTQFVLREACERGLKLVTAESCTGGLLASLLTDIPGRSHAFERGFVTYTDEAKNQVLGVPSEVLATDGAVSERSARAMAKGALANSQGDIAVSITGYAEPGPNGEPGGLVHFACARTNRPIEHVMKEFGNVGRAEVRLRALEVALKLMRDAMIEPAKTDAA
jgi:nicotinamide-nucleotide amidase